jgi:hypothetical protein
MAGGDAEGNEARADDAAGNVGKSKMDMTEDQQHGGFLPGRQPSSGPAQTQHVS